MRERDAIPTLAANMFRGMINLMTNPADMFREAVRTLANPGNIIDLSRQLLLGSTTRDDQNGTTYVNQNAVAGGFYSPQRPCQPRAISYPQLAYGPFEQVLAFNSQEEVTLKGLPQTPYLSAHGTLCDLFNNDLPGSSVLRTFPIELSLLDAALRWPREQEPPFDVPPVDATNSTDFGYSKQACFFGNGSSIVTVGPSLPKITVLRTNGIQFWVVSCGVISQATGIYEGARGAAVYSGSAYFQTWPDSLEERIRILTNGFRVSICSYIKLIFKRDDRTGTVSAGRGAAGHIRPMAQESGPQQFREPLSKG